MPEDEPHIGEVIARHMITIGFLAPPGTPAEAAEKVAGAAMGAQPGDEAGAAAHGAPFRQCPKCGQASLIHQEGCDMCTSCTYSKCG